MDGVYCGCCAAYAIIQAIHSLGRIEGIDQSLTTEYDPGHIKSCGEMERTLENAA